MHRMHKLCSVSYELFRRCRTADAHILCTEAESSFCWLCTLYLWCAGVTLYKVTRIVPVASVCKSHALHESHDFTCIISVAGVCESHALHEGHGSQWMIPVAGVSSSLAGDAPVGLKYWSTRWANMATTLERPPWFQ